MTAVLLGGSGVLGSAYRQVLAGREPVVHLRPPWHDEAGLAEWFTRHLATSVDDGRLDVLWAAGVGHVGATADGLRAETVGLSGLVTAVERLPASLQSATTVLFASSAGALFAGRAGEVVDESTTPAPVSAYGAEKLVQERLLRELAERQGVRTVMCRISNLFGLASRQVTRRGLVSAAVRCSRTQMPLTVYVAPDTRRDYLYNVDAARTCLALRASAPDGWSTALVRDGRTRTITEVLATISRVAGRRVPVNYAERAETRLQPRALRFAADRSTTGAAARRTPFEVAAALMLRAPLAA